MNRASESPADGPVTRLYSQSPPMWLASRPSGECQSYDTIYLAPRCNGRREMIQTANAPVFHNGHLADHAVNVPGKDSESAIALQNHFDPVHSAITGCGRRVVVIRRDGP